MFDKSKNTMVDAVSETESADALAVAKGRVRARRSGAARAGVSLVLVVGLSAACVPGALAHSAEVAEQAQQQVVAQSATAEYEKTEVVYATLSAVGAVEGVYVVNQFDVSSAGSVVDFGPYGEVRNLTDQTDLVRSAGSVSFDVNEGAFYYQGNVEADKVKLPWDVHVAYALDGKTVQPGDLAGKSGALKIHLTTSPAAGADEAFLDSYMLQATFTLDGATTSNIVAEGATIASSGTDRTVAFTVLPGQNADCTLEAQVTDFEMTGVSIVALPYSMAMDMPSTDAMTDGIGQLSSSISSLSNGIGQLDGNAGGLVEASASINSMFGLVSGMLSAREDLAALDQVEVLADLPERLDALADALDELRQKLEDLAAEYPDAFTQLDAAVAGLPAGTDSQAIEAARAAVAGTEAEADVEALIQAYEQAEGAAAAVKDAYGNGQAFEGAQEVIASLVGEHGFLATSAETLRNVASVVREVQASGAMVENLGQLLDGVYALVDGYGQFHSGLVSYIDGVGEVADGMAQLNSATISLPATMRAEIEKLMADCTFPEFEPASLVDARNDANMKAVQFVMTTGAIEVPQPQIEEACEEDQTILDRFFALFQ